MRDDLIVNKTAQASEMLIRRRLQQIAQGGRGSASIDTVGLRDLTRGWPRDLAEFVIEKVEAVVAQHSNNARLTERNKEGFVYPLPTLELTSADEFRKYVFPPLRVPTDTTRKFPAGKSLDRLSQPDIGYQVAVAIPVLDMGLSVQHMDSDDLIGKFGWSREWFDDTFKQHDEGHPSFEDSGRYRGHPLHTGLPSHYQKFHCYNITSGTLLVRVNKKAFRDGKFVGPRIEREAIEMRVFAQNSILQFCGGIRRSDGQRIYANIPESWYDARHRLIDEQRERFAKRKAQQIARQDKTRNKQARKQNNKPLASDDRPEWVDELGPEGVKLYEQAMRKTVGALTDIAKDSGLSGYSKLRKTGLVKLLITQGVI